MRPSTFFRTLTVLLLCWPSHAQDPAIKDALLHGKTLWASSGDRDGAIGKFELVIATLEPKAKTLSIEWLAVLCESYNWLAVLDDRTPSRKARVAKDLETLLAINPDFEVDKSITNARMQKQFEELRNSKLCRVKFALEPDNGTLLVDGAIRKGGPVRFLAPGSKKIAYAKPGYKTIEQQVELGLRETKSLEFKLNRVSSTVTLHISPSGAEVLVDGRVHGVAQGTASLENKPIAEKLGVSLQELSGPFTIQELSPGKHTVEFRAMGYQTKQMELGAAFSEPFADHVLEPVKLEISRSSLTVESSTSDGELFLSGKSYGPLPVQGLQLSAGSYELQVKYPVGAFIQQVNLQEGGSLAIKARPMSRMVFLGLDSGDFAGKDRLIKAFEAFGSRLTNIACIKPQENERPLDTLTRIKASKEAELILSALPVSGSFHELELVLGTLNGEEERTLIKPLEQDPLGTMIARINNIPELWQLWAGITVVDVSSEKGPVLIQAEETAQQAGAKLYQPITHVNGKPVPNAAALNKAVQSASHKTEGSLQTVPQITITQGTNEIKLPLQRKAMEIPLNASNLCYPSLLMELNLRQASAKSEESGFLRLNQAICLMHFQLFDRALEALRGARVSGQSGICQGTVDYYSGLCLQRLGSVYLPEAIQSFNQALKYPNATLFGPEGPLLAPLAKQSLSDLKP